MKRLTFPKKKRLVNNRQFKAVLSRGQRLSNELLTLYMAKNDCGFPRLGISVKKSYGNAVVRNRLKRLLREAFRQNQDQIPVDFDYFLMFSPQWLSKLNADSALGCRKGRLTAQPTFEQVKNSFLSLVQCRKACE